MSVAEASSNPSPSPLFPFASSAPKREDKDDVKAEHSPSKTLALAERMLRSVDSVDATTQPSELSIPHQAYAREDLGMSPDKLDADWMLTKYFGSIYVINLPHATERRVRVTSTLREIGTSVFEILPATNGRDEKEVDPAIRRKMYMNWAKIDISTEEGREKLLKQHQGETGCFISHLRAIQTVREKYTQAAQMLKSAQSSGESEKMKEAAALVRKFSSVLILEDDNGFGIVSADKKSSTLKEVGTLFRKAMSALPENWDMLYLMGMERRPAIRVADHLAKVDGVLCLNAIAVSHRVYDALFNRLNRLFDPTVSQVHPVDGEYAALHKDHNCFGLVPSICFQGNGLSSITSKVAEHLRQTQSIKKEQRDTSGSYIRWAPQADPASIPPSTDSYFQFPEEALTLADLARRIVELEKEDSTGFKRLTQAIKNRLNEYLLRKQFERSPHNFDANISLRRLEGPGSLNANDLYLGVKRNFILHACPETMQETALLLEVALKDNCIVFASTRKTTDAQNRFCNFWQKDKISRIKTTDNWTFTPVAERVLVRSEKDQAAIVETSFLAHKDGAARQITQLHFDGWTQDSSMPDRALFKHFIERIEEQQAKSEGPVSLESTWGVGRNGVTAATLVLRQEIREQLASGKPLNEIVINIPRVIFEMRKLRNGIVEHAPLIRDVFYALADFYEELKSKSQAAEYVPPTDFLNIL